MCIPAPSVKNIWSILAVQRFLKAFESSESFNRGHAFGSYPIINLWCDKLTKRSIQARIEEPLCLHFTRIYYWFVYLLYSPSVYIYWNPPQIILCLMWPYVRGQAFMRRNKEYFALLLFISDPIVNRWWRIIEWEDKNGGEEMVLINFCAISLSPSSLSLSLFTGKRWYVGKRGRSCVRGWAGWDAINSISNKKLFPSQNYSIFIVVPETFKASSLSMGKLQKTNFSTFLQSLPCYLSISAHTSHDKLDQKRQNHAKKCREVFFSRFHATPERRRDNKEERCQITPDLILIIHEWESWGYTSGGDGAGRCRFRFLSVGIYWKKFSLSFVAPYILSLEAENFSDKIKDRKASSFPAFFFVSVPPPRSWLHVVSNFLRIRLPLAPRTTSFIFIYLVNNKTIKCEKKRMKIYRAAKSTSRVSFLFVLPPLFTPCTFTFNQHHNKRLGRGKSINQQINFTFSQEKEQIGGWGEGWWWGVKCETFL